MVKRIEPKWIVVSNRVYGSPRLKKPDEIKGIKQAGSVDFIPNKCKCPIYVKEDDVFIKHRDYFSEIFALEEYVGTSLSTRANLLGIKTRNKFIYEDNWGSIVLRNEAWIKISNSVKWLRNAQDERMATKKIQSLASSYYKTDMSLYDWGRFLEKVVIFIRNTSSLE